MCNEEKRMKERWDMEESWKEKQENENDWKPKKAAAVNSATFDVLTEKLWRQASWYVKPCQLVATDISKDRSAFIFRVKQDTLLSLLHDAVYTSETSVTTSQPNIKTPEDFSFQMVTTLYKV